MKLAPPAAAAPTPPNGEREPAAEAGRFLWCGPRLVPWCVTGSATIAGLVAPRVTATIDAWPFVVALFVFGMPHGAADWAVAARLNHRSGFAQRLVGFVGYLLMMAACTALIAWQPGVAALLFLALTVFHFGMADATAVHADDDGPVARWSLVGARGCLLLATAFACHPDAAWAPFGEIAARMGIRPGETWLPDMQSLRSAAWLGVGAGAVLAIIAALARASRGRRIDALLDLAEHALVALMAAFADPLFAVGCFFLGTHAFRHTRRLACTREVIEPPPAAASLAARLLRVHALSLPLMGPTALCLAPLCWLLGGFGMQQVAVASIAFYMITTLPHHLLGLRLPRPDLRPA